MYPVFLKSMGNKYYRKYDPINFKTPPYERNAIDVFGNKMYRVKRSDTMTPGLLSTDTKSCSLGIIL